MLMEKQYYWRKSNDYVGLKMQNSNMYTAANKSEISNVMFNNLLFLAHIERKI